MRAARRTGLAVGVLPDRLKLHADRPPIDTVMVLLDSHQSFQSLSGRGGVLATQQRRGGADPSRRLSP
ncbi:hypothetical protein ADK90_10365 [Streptomyces sp. XY413]|uniref:hypothetical protein n=1 Tax=Streptomyces sp. XY413 TaxID=1519479 RepID=UPI0006AF963F|nr:hypothetical protein [Streptomyces sp. XY413]KOV22472.1 hypothetical protein ADK90_10365 [Streptomyces sp. XY413]